MRIPGADLRAQNLPLRDALRAAFERLLDSGAFVLGPDVRAFEEAFAAYCESGQCVGVGNGTDALVLALRALDIGPGDAVVVPAFTFAATAEAVCLVGAEPLFVDIDPLTFTLDPAALEALLRRERTRVKAVLPVHLYGQVAAMDEILLHSAAVGAAVVEDAAQAHGARYRGKRAGSFGALACFSFYPTKNLGAAGDGGAITTRDPELAARLRRLRDHGQSAKYEHAVVGYNSRLDTLQAAVLHAKLAHLDAWNERRRAIAARYVAALDDLDWLTLPRVAAEREHVYHLFVVRCADRDGLQRHLAEAGIATSIHYPRALHQQPAFAAFAPASGTLPEAEAAAREVLALPCYPELSDAAVDSVCETVRAWTPA